MFHGIGSSPDVQDCDESSLQRSPAVAQRSCVNEVDGHCKHYDDMIPKLITAGGSSQPELFSVQESCRPLKESMHSNAAAGSY